MWFYDARLSCDGKHLVRRKASQYRECAVLARELLKEERRDRAEGVIAERMPVEIDDIERPSRNAVHLAHQSSGIVIR